MSKYNIDKSFKIGTKFKITLNKQVVFLAKIVLKNSDKYLKHRKDIMVKKETINVQNGTINIHIIIPNNHLTKIPCLFYLHGGAFAFDIQPHQYKIAANYAIKTDSIIILPHYRLTPNASNSVILNDCIESWKWTLENIKKYNIDPNKIGIGGDSAGAYLAAKLTNMIIKDQNNIKYQLLIYPVIDSKMRTNSMKKYIDTPMWNAKNNKTMWQWFYNNEKEETSLLDISLPTNLPPTYIETAEFDCLHDEGILYANKLKSLGIDVTINETKHTMHGFDIFNTEITQKNLLTRNKFIKKQIKKEK